MLTKNHAALTQEVAAHIEADAVIAGHYWEADNNAVGGTGCFIGCLSHGESAQDVTDRFGLPLPLVKIAENIFESLSEKDRRDFFAAIPAAVGGNGKDLSLVHWKFLAAELRALPAVPSNIQNVIDPVILGIELLAGGGDWPRDAADAAADAAARIRQRDTFLSLISDAEVTK